MKIKKKVQGTTDVIEVAEGTTQEPCPYDGAISCIKGAIDALAQLPDDEVARDSIANLSVVLFDLNC